MEKLLCPSMMCANFAHLETEIRELEEAGIDIFHVDVMDGNFVPNFGMGLQDLEYITKTAKKPVDAHLMVDDPGRYVQRFAALGADILYIHPEADRHPARTLQMILDSDCKAGLAIDPDTAVETIEPLLSLVDFLLVMTVNPGFAGQRYLDFVDGKLEKLCRLKAQYGYHIVIDGACSPERIRTLSENGADGFVLGTSALFGKGRPYRTIIEELRSSLGAV